jgi:hypothetical protein
MNVNLFRVKAVLLVLPLFMVKMLLTVAIYKCLKAVKSRWFSVVKLHILLSLSLVLLV